MNDDELAAEKARIRAAFPICIEFADEMRELFGDGVRIVYMSEDGREIGERSPEPVKQDEPPAIEHEPRRGDRRWRFK